jgi:hypothetical protein
LDCFIIIILTKYGFLLLMSNEENKYNSTTISNISRQDRLKDIDALYRSQIKQIYNESKETIESKQSDRRDVERMLSPKISSVKVIQQRDKDNSKSSLINLNSIDKSNYFNLNFDQRSEEEKIRASTFLKGESTRAI